jgi:hypothetical protein
VATISRKASEVAETRTTAQGNTFEVAAIRAFLARLLADDLLADAVNDLLFEHVVAGRYHPSVVAESLRPFVDEVLNTTTVADWQAVADQLIAEAREINGEV